MSHRFHLVIYPTDFEAQQIDEQYVNGLDWLKGHRIKYIYAKRHDHQAKMHYHIYVEFSVMRKWKYVKNLLGFDKAHVEKCFDCRFKNLFYINNGEKGTEPNQDGVLFLDD